MVHKLWNCPKLDRRQRNTRYFEKFCLRRCFRDFKAIVFPKSEPLSEVWNRINYHFKDPSSIHRQYAILNVMARSTFLINLVPLPKEELINMQRFTSPTNIHCLRVFSNLQEENPLDQVFNPVNRSSLSTLIPSQVSIWCPSISGPDWSTISMILKPF